MTYLLVSANARTGTKIYAALAATAALAFVSASDVLAQGVPQQQPQQQRPAQQRPPAAQQQQRPAQPQQQQPAQQQQQAAPQQQQAGGEQPQLIFSPWVKLCNKDPDPNSKRCLLYTSPSPRDS